MEKGQHNSKELNTRIEIALSSLQIKILSEKYLEKLEKKILSNKKELLIMEKQVEAEYLDVELLLNSSSIESIFRLILKDKSAQLEIEKQEYLQAVLSYKDLVKQKDLLHFEYKIIKTKVKSINKEKADLSILLKQRENEIKGTKKEFKSKYLKLYQENDNLQVLNQDINEALFLGKQNMDLILQIITKLSHAAKLRNWRFGKAKSNYSNEKSFIDDSVELYNELKIKLFKFEGELEDVYEKKEIKLENNIYKFEKFIDVYYNYLINDWIVRQRISNTLNMMEALKDDLLRIILTLENEEKNSKIEIMKVKEHINQLILKNETNN